MDYSAIEINALRDRRRALEGEEQEISYLRRMLQGRIDILREELADRGYQAESASLDTRESQLIDKLPQILSDSNPGRSSATRHVSIDARVGSTVGTDSSGGEVAQVIADTSKSDPSVLNDDDLVRSIEVLTQHEKLVSRDRAVVHVELDAISSELTQRYVSGSAQVDDLLAHARIRRNAS